ncbi:hypothetical protein KR222_002523, partial [Zaprionus bogoriensis]
IENMLKKLIILIMLATRWGMMALAFAPFDQEQGSFGEIYAEENALELYTIEGVILRPDPALRVGAKWPADINLSINSGEYKGYVRRDGSFVISAVPAGSYIIDVHHPDILIQSVRVEISSSGRIRARKLSYLRPQQIQKLQYPLHLKPLGRRKYFRMRETWNFMDYVMNPMVLLMVVPLMLMLLLPRLINDPETKREIENIQFPKIPNGMPDLSDMLTSFLAGKRNPDKPKKPATAVA